MSKEIAKQIRKELKEKLDLNSKDVSVTSRRSLYDDSIRIRVKKLTALEPIENIAKEYEEIRYDYSGSGEILAGCNTFIFVEYDHDFIREEAKKYNEVAKKIIENHVESGYFKRIMQNDKIRISYDGMTIAVIKGYLDSDIYSFDEKYCAHNEYHVAEALTRIEAKYGKFEIK
jgi:hypothetical protein